MPKERRAKKIRSCPACPGSEYKNIYSHIKSTHRLNPTSIKNKTTSVDQEYARALAKSLKTNNFSKAKLLLKYIEDDKPETKHIKCKVCKATCLINVSSFNKHLSIYHAFKHLIKNTTDDLSDKNDASDLSLPQCSNEAVHMLLGSDNASTDKQRVNPVSSYPESSPRLEVSQTTKKIIKPNDSNIKKSVSTNNGHKLLSRSWTTRSTGSLPKFSGNVADVENRLLNDSLSQSQSSDEQLEIECISKREVCSLLTDSSSRPHSSQEKFDSENTISENETCRTLTSTKVQNVHPALLSKNNSEQESENVFIATEANRKEKQSNQKSNQERDLNLRPTRKSINEVVFQLVQMQKCDSNIPVKLNDSELTETTELPNILKMTQPQSDYSTNTKCSFKWETPTGSPEPLQESRLMSEFVELSTQRPDDPVTACLNNKNLVVDDASQMVIDVPINKNKCCACPDCLFLNLKYHIIKRHQITSNMAEAITLSEALKTNNEIEVKHLIKNYMTSLPDEKRIQCVYCNGVVDRFLFKSHLTNFHKLHRVIPRGLALGESFATPLLIDLTKDDDDENPLPETVTQNCTTSKLFTGLQRNQLLPVKTELQIGKELFETPPGSPESNFSDLNKETLLVKHEPVHFEASESFNDEYQLTQPAVNDLNLLNSTDFNIPPKMEKTEEQPTRIIKGIPEATLPRRSIRIKTQSVSVKSEPWPEPWSERTPVGSPALKRKR